MVSALWDKLDIFDSTQENYEVKKPVAIETWVIEKKTYLQIRFVQKREILLNIQIPLDWDLWNMSRATTMDNRGWMRIFQLNKIKQKIILELWFIN